VTWVLVPTHSRWDLLPQALQHLDAPVLVVDDSPGGAQIPAHLEVLRSPGELGFAGAVNLGLEQLEQRGVERVLVLNDDAVPQPGCLEALEAAFTDEVALAGPVLVDPSGGIESAGIDYSPRTARVKVRTRVPSAITAVPALSGACLLMRTSLRFDEGFPHAMEDIELATRAPGAVLLVPQARCLHLGGATVDRRSAEATRDALVGHLRLVGDRPLQQGLAVGYALAQVLREGNRRQRLVGLARALRGR
jgi:GT2 family glycosyltransferase